MTITITRDATASTTRLAQTPVWVVGAGSAAVGAVALFTYGTVAKALSVPMHAGEIGASHANPITPFSFSVGVLFSTFFGTLLAVALARWAKDPAQTFLRTSLALVAVSLFFPLAASHTPESTRLTLALGHLIAAAIIVPAITRRLSDVPRSSRS